MTIPRCLCDQPHPGSAAPTSDTADVLRRCDWLQGPLRTGVRVFCSIHHGMEGAIHARVPDLAHQSEFDDTCSTWTMILNISGGTSVCHTIHQTIIQYHGFVANQQSGCASRSFQMLVQQILGHKTEECNVTIKDGNQ